MYTDTIVLEIGAGEHGKGKIRLSGYPEDIQLACEREFVQFDWGVDGGDGQNWSVVEAEAADFKAVQATVYRALPEHPSSARGAGMPEPSGWVLQTLMFTLPL